MHPFTNTWVSICFGHSEQKESQVYWGSFVSRVIVSFVNEEENRETEEEILKMIWDKPSQKVKAALSCFQITIFSSIYLRNLQHSQIVFNRPPAEVHLPESSRSHWLFLFPILSCTPCWPPPNGFHPLWWRDDKLVEIVVGKKWFCLREWALRMECFFFRFSFYSVSTLQVQSLQSLFSLISFNRLYSL